MYERAQYLASQTLGGGYSNDGTLPHTDHPFDLHKGLSTDDLHAIERDQQALHGLLNQVASRSQLHKQHEIVVEEFMDHASDHLNHSHHSHPHQVPIQTPLHHHGSLSRPTSASSKAPLATMGYTDKGYTL